MISTSKRRHHTVLLSLYGRLYEDSYVTLHEKDPVYGLNQQMTIPVLGSVEQYSSVLLILEVLAVDRGCVSRKLIVAVKRVCTSDMSPLFASSSPSISSLSLFTCKGPRSSIIVWGNCAANPVRAR